MKVDVSKIEGYESMSAEEKLKAIESYEFAEPDYSGYVTKDTFDKTASELAKAKKDLKAKLSEEEQKAIEAKEERERIEAELAALKKDKAISDSVKKFMANGYSEELANSSAVALYDGDFDTFFKNQSTHLAQFATKVKSDYIATTPYPQGGAEKPSVMTLKEFRKLPADQREKWARENPDEYRLLYGG